MNKGYDDIIDLPHHVSRKHPRMSMTDRAAQFSPFAALSGYEAATQEAARLTVPQIELAEDAKAILEQRLHLLSCTIADHPEITITYFQPDKRKTGGSYVTITGTAKRIDAVEGTIIIQDGSKIMIDDITNICLSEK